LPKDKLSTYYLLAAEGAHLEVVQFLVDEVQADVNNADSSKQTSLHVLAGVERETQRHIQTMAFLLEKGADPNAEADDQYTRTKYYNIIQLC